MGVITRQNYLDKIERYIGKDAIIILTGQRRVGKSVILRLFRDKMSASAHANIIYIDKEKKEFDGIKTYQDLNAYIDKLRNKKKANFILIDEVQEIEDFEKSIRIDYLQGLNERYENWIAGYKGHLIIVDGDNLKFEGNQDSFRQVTDMIDAKLYGLFPMD